MTSCGGSNVVIAVLVTSCGGSDVIVAEIVSRARVSGIYFWCVWGGGGWSVKG